MILRRRGRSSEPAAAVGWAVIGLGNPGAEYADTRHNVGFRVVDILARRHGIKFAHRVVKSVLGEGEVGGRRVALVRPMTFMNLSGDAVAAIARRYTLAPSQLLVVLDDAALPLGRLRLRAAGSGGGHNGLEHIIERLATREIPRIRIGIGPARGGELIDHVLSPFTVQEQPVIGEACELAADAAECAMGEGFADAMNRFNGGG